MTNIPFTCDLTVTWVLSNLDAGIRKFTGVFFALNGLSTSLLTLIFNSVNILITVPNCVMVARLTLAQFVRVQILLRQPKPSLIRWLFYYLIYIAYNKYFSYNVTDEQKTKAMFFNFFNYIYCNRHDSYDYQYSYDKFLEKICCG